VSRVGVMTAIAQVCELPRLDPVLPAASTMRKNAWTTLEEYSFLETYIPRFLKQQEIRIVAPFLAEVAAAFLEKFPSHRKEFDRESLVPVILFRSFVPLPFLILTLENPHLVW
jgi:hypothetical protein